ncbi:MAG: hypothetical protein AB2748_21525, partial [Candidatus Thiodiazotropha endolucinida]
LSNQCSAGTNLQFIDIDQYKKSYAFVNWMYIIKLQELFSKYSQKPTNKRPFRAAGFITVTMAEPVKSEL